MTRAAVMGARAADLARGRGVAWGQKLIGRARIGNAGHARERGTATRERHARRPRETAGASRLRSIPRPGSGPAPNPLRTALTRASSLDRPRGFAQNVVLL